MISVTFDDALEQHLDVAVRVLNEYGLRGTFYANLSATGLVRRVNDWTKAAERGHELGNHSIFHAGLAAKDWVREGNAIELYTLDRMALELEVANQWLHSIDGREKRSFAYPCSNPVLGHYGWPCRLLTRAGLKNTRWPGLLKRAGLDFGNNRVNYQTVVEDLFVAARGSGLQVEDEAPSLDQFQRFNLPSPTVNHHSFDDMKGYIERSLAKQSWAILQFHGVGGGHHLDCDAAEFRKLISWIAEHHLERVCTVADGADRLLPAPLQRRADA